MSMTESLKAYLTRLARSMNVGEATLYERQRALVREGLLEVSPGQGRGSGVRATPDSLGMLLISFLASVNLSDAASLAKEIAKAKPVSGKCPLTGATTYREAVAKVLSNSILFDQAKKLSVSGLRGTAEISYGDDKVSAFVGRASEKEGIRLTISLDFGEMKGFERLTSDMMREAKS